MRSTMILLLGALAVTPAVLGAQAGGETPRESQLRMLAYQRKMLLAMADSMPERLYRDKATPTQRDFAEQIHHAANTAAYIASATLKGPPLDLPDTAVALNSRAGMRRFINGAFDYAEGVFKSENAAARAATTDLFGQKMPTWQVWDEIYTHTVYMGGQVVGNFRKYGMAPPAFAFF
jgi:hypothetical protein